MYTEEQQYWSEQMQAKFEACHAASENLKFLEEKLGKVHRIVIDYRKFIQKFDNEFVIAQENFIKCGGLDVCCE
jgi:hypothetical protein